MAIARSIGLEVNHPFRQPGRVEGFRFLWAFRVSGFRPDRHCQPCFKGRRVGSFSTATVRTGEPVTVDMPDRYPYLYVCGVGAGEKKDLHRQNLHMPLRYAKGKVVARITYNGYCVVARDAELVPIPPLERGWNGLDDETTQCKNFQFAVAYFGLP
jgi:hypothetical protein